MQQKRLPPRTRPSIRPTAHAGAAPRKHAGGAEMAAGVAWPAPSGEQPPMCSQLSACPIACRHGRRRGKRGRRCRRGRGDNLFQQWRVALCGPAKILVHTPCKRFLHVTRLRATIQCTSCGTRRPAAATCGCRHHVAMCAAYGHRALVKWGICERFKRQPRPLPTPGLGHSHFHSTPAGLHGISSKLLATLGAGLRANFVRECCCT